LKRKKERKKERGFTDRGLKKIRFQVKTILVKRLRGIEIETKLVNI